jgi:hypothetical protein
MKYQSRKGDKVLEKIIKEVAEKHGLKFQTVWELYNNYYDTVFNLLTAVPLRNMNQEYKREHSVNINIPGFGKIHSIYGKK